MNQEIVQYKDLEAVGLSVEDSKQLLEAYDIDVESISNALIKSSDVKVKSLDDKDEMKRAKTLRLALAKHRLSIQSRHDELKKGLLARTKAIDLVNRVFSNKIKEAEKYLKSQEDYAKIVEEKRLAELQAARAEELAGLTDDLTQYMSRLKVMTDEEFAGLKANLIAAKEAAKKEEERRAAEAKAAEEARIAAEVERRLEEERKKKVAEAPAPVERVEPAPAPARAKEGANAHDLDLVSRKIKQLRLDVPNLFDERYVKLVEEINVHLDKNKAMYLDRLNSL